MIVSSRRIIVPITLAASFTLLYPHDSSARCDCLCVDGEVEAVCESSLNIKPICAPRICPIDRPSLEPIKPPRLPPLGADECRQARVLIGRIYEWHTICE